MLMIHYVGAVKDETFDYEIAKARKGNWSGYSPSIIYEFRDCRGDLLDWNSEDVVQADWGCWIQKMITEELQEYVAGKVSDRDYETLKVILKPKQEYLLVDMEDISCE